MVGGYQAMQLLTEARATVAVSRPFITVIMPGTAEAVTPVVENTIPYHTILHHAISLSAGDDSLIGSCQLFSLSYITTAGPVSPWSHILHSLLSLSRKSIVFHDNHPRSLLLSLLPMLPVPC